MNLDSGIVSSRQRFASSYAPISSGTFRCPCVALNHSRFRHFSIAGHAAPIAPNAHGLSALKNRLLNSFGVIPSARSSACAGSIFTAARTGNAFGMSAAAPVVVVVVVVVDVASFPTRRAMSASIAAPKRCTISPGPPMMCAMSTASIARRSSAVSLSSSRSFASSAATSARSPASAASLSCPRT